MVCDAKTVRFHTITFGNMGWNHSGKETGWEGVLSQNLTLWPHWCELRRVKEKQQVHSLILIFLLTLTLSCD